MADGEDVGRRDNVILRTRFDLAEGGFADVDGGPEGGTMGGGIVEEFAAVSAILVSDGSDDLGSTMRSRLSC